MDKPVDLCLRRLIAQTHVEVRPIPHAEEVHVGNRPGIYIGVLLRELLIAISHEIDNQNVAVIERMKNLGRLQEKKFGVHVQLASPIAPPQAILSAAVLRAKALARGSDTGSPHFDQLLGLGRGDNRQATHEELHWRPIKHEHGRNAVPYLALNNHHAVIPVCLLPTASTKLTTQLTLRPSVGSGQRWLNFGYQPAGELRIRVAGRDASPGQRPLLLLLLFLLLRLLLLCLLLPRVRPLVKDRWARAGARSRHGHTKGQWPWQLEPREMLWCVHDWNYELLEISHTYHGRAY